MLFIHPMWSHESQRLGKQRCSPAAYGLHVIGDGLGFIGLLSLLVVLVLLATGLVAGGLRWILLLVPLGLGFLGAFLFHLSWWVVHRRGFHYDEERCEASWIEAGERRTYRYGDP